MMLKLKGHPPVLMRRPDGDQITPFSRTFSKVIQPVQQRGRKCAKVELRKCKIIADSGGGGGGGGGGPCPNTNPPNYPLIHGTLIFDLFCTGGGYLCSAKSCSQTLTDKTTNHVFPKGLLVCVPCFPIPDSLCVYLAPQESNQLSSTEGFVASCCTIRYYPPLSKSRYIGGSRLLHC